MNYEELYKELKALVIDISCHLGNNTLCPSYMFDDINSTDIPCEGDCEECFKKAFDIFENNMRKKGS